VLLLIDYYVNRKFTKKSFAEKIPFLALSVIFGIIAIFAHQSQEIASVTEKFNFTDRFFLICFGLVQYIVMLFFPFKSFAQSAIHYYPDKVNGVFPIEYYIAPAIILILITLVFAFKRYRKDMIFGFLFFLITISVVSQVIVIGDSIICERYIYIPYMIILHNRLYLQSIG